MSLGGGEGLDLGFTFSLENLYWIHEKGTNITKEDKSIRLNRNLIHRMIISKTTQKPTSTA
jgi:hypothetical protein